MSVIRHGEVIEVVYDAERIVVHAPACASHAHAVCDCEPAVFVAADQLQGAVSDLRELCEALEGVQMVGGRHGGKTRLNEAWKRARSRLDGGQ